MTLSREQALELLQTWTLTDSLRKHAYGVEASMRKAAEIHGSGEADIERWGLTGLLHDADYEQWPEDHPKRIMEWLRKRGEEDIAYAIACHYQPWGLDPSHPMDKALLACDELTGFVMACCLVRPEGIHSLAPKSVKKKLKTKTFAAAVHREDVTQGAALLGVPLDEHISMIIEALKPHAELLGIAGSGSSEEGSV